MRGCARLTAGLSPCCVQAPKPKHRKLGPVFLREAGEHNEDFVGPCARMLAFLRALKVVTIAKGEYIYHSGRRSSHCYLVLSGVVGIEGLPGKVRAPLLWLLPLQPNRGMRSVS